MYVYAICHITEKHACTAVSQIVIECCEQNNKYQQLVYFFCVAMQISVG
jgi:hypothetical protein